jgi:hypothetical protein
MIAVFVWTFRDVMEATGFGLFVLFWLLLGGFLICVKIIEKLAERRRRNNARP